MKKYKLNYLILLIMFVFTVSSCKEGMKEIKKVIEQTNALESLKKVIEQTNALESLSEIDTKVDERAMSFGYLMVLQTLYEAGFPLLDESKNSLVIKRALVTLHFEVVKILREAGVNADVENDILIKVASAHFEFIKILKGVGPDNIELLSRFIGKQDLEIKQVLSEAGVKVDAGENNILSKIFAVQLNIFEILLQAGFKFEINEENKMSINIALAKGHLEFVRTLKNVRDHIDLVSRLASTEGYLDFVQVLRDANDEINTEREESINRAKNRVLFEIEKTLSEAGVEVNETLMEEVLSKYRNNEELVNEKLMEKILSKYRNNEELAHEILMEKVLSKYHNNEKLDNETLMEKVLSKYRNNEELDNEKLMEKILSAYRNNEKLDNDMFLLLVATAKVMVDIEKVLSEAGVKVEAESDTLIKMSLANFEFYKALRDANIEADLDNNTLIKMALAKGYIDVVKILRDADVRFNVESDTLLRIALVYLTDAKNISNVKSKKEKRILVDKLSQTVNHILRDAGVRFDVENDILMKMALVYFDVIKALKEIGVKLDVASDLFKLVNMVSSEEHFRFVRDLSEARIKADAENKASANAKANQCNEIFND